VNLIHLFNHCLRLVHFLARWNEAEIIFLPRPGNDPTLAQNLRPISLLSTTGKLLEKLTLRTIQKHTEETNLLNASQFGFRADQSTTLQYVWLADHVSLNFNNFMSTTDVFLDIEETFDTTWQFGLLYKLSEI
jgi:hypothetical protein